MCELSQTLAKRRVKSLSVAIWRSSAAFSTWVSKSLARRQLRRNQAGVRSTTQAFGQDCEAERAFGSGDDFDLAAGGAGHTWAGVGLRSARRRRLPRETFAGVRWSSTHALGDTLAILKGARIATPEALADVDSGDDLARLRTADRDQTNPK